MTDVQNELIQIIKRLLNGRPVENLEISAETKAFARMHSLEHIVGFVSQDTSLPLSAAHHVLKQSIQINAAAKILEKCEERGLFVIPLKGICIVNRYRDPVLRSMGDIDLLYQANQHHELKNMMLDLGYQWGGENQKHDHYTKAPYVCVEVHREMVPSGCSYAAYYENIWAKASAKDGCRYVHILSAEDEVIYCVVHAAIHFKMGGIGVRPLMDLYVYNHSGIDFDYVDAELEKLHLLEFYRKLTAVSEKWFGDSETVDETFLKLEDYILNSGLYGTDQNVSAVSVAEGRGAYAFKMAFPSLDKMKSAYLWLETYPFLLPYAWAKRIFRVLIKKKDTFHSQVQIVKNGDQALGRQIKAFWKECGLE